MDIGWVTLIVSVACGVAGAIGALALGQPELFRYVQRFLVVITLPIAGVGVGMIAASYIIEARLLEIMSGNGTLPWAIDIPQDKMTQVLRMAWENTQAFVKPEVTAIRPAYWMLGSCAFLWVALWAGGALAEMKLKLGTNRDSKANGSAKPTQEGDSVPKANDER